MNTTAVVRINDIIEECNNIKTFKFEYPWSIQPGQFFMVWIPYVDEIPMSVSYIENAIKGITFRKVGEATNTLYNLDIGNKIGLRGPYGTSFTITGKHILFVGGGTGIATIAPAVEEAKKNHVDATVVLGAKNKDELFFEERMIKSNVEVYVSTDDGSKGFKGFASDLALDLISKKTFTSIIACGPELMMKKIITRCEGIPFQASVERYIKCGVGLCGQCSIGNGQRVCIEGPVFDGATLRKFRDFGKYKRDATGKKEYIKR